MFNRKLFFKNPPAARVQSLQHRFHDAGIGARLLLHYVQMFFGNVESILLEHHLQNFAAS